MAASRIRARVVRSPPAAERMFNTLNRRSGAVKGLRPELLLPTPGGHCRLDAVANSAPPTTDDGRYERQPFRFTDRITADGRDGWPAAPGRYRLGGSRGGAPAHRGAD